MPHSDQALSPARRHHAPVETLRQNWSNHPQPSGSRPTPAKPRQVHIGDRLNSRIGIRERPIKIFLSESPHTEVFGLQVRLIGFRTDGAGIHRDMLAIASQQLGLQGLGRRLCDLVLDGKDIVHLPVVSLGPKMKTIIRLNQFRRDAYVIAVAAYASLKDMSDTEFASHVTYVLVPALELKSGRPSNDL